MNKTTNIIKAITLSLLALTASIAFASEAEKPNQVEKPYQVIDGKIDKNTFEGWRSFRGGTCGVCHGGAGQGGAGPNLTISLVEKIDKEMFVKIVTNGRSGTLMKPFKNNNRVIDNLDNIYAYLKARSDGVLGPENLIKFPLGTK